ncbi:general substrate transporter [Peziza echinospora]|nr:general substrate transporter [Peziza echinospora]
MLPVPLLYSLASAAIAPLLFGYHLAELNAPEYAIRCPSVSSSPHTASSALGFDDPVTAFTLPPCISLSVSNFGLVTSIFAFGGLFGALMGGPMSNRYGRRGALLLCSIGFALGGAIMTVASGVGGLALGRIVSGVASGAAVVVVPLYIHDLAPRGEKGSFGAITQISVNAGILLTQSLGLFLSKESLWRFILGVGAFLGAIQGLMLLTAKESPKWLAANHRREEAEEILKELRGGSLTVAEVSAELDHHSGASAEDSDGSSEADPLIPSSSGDPESHTSPSQRSTSKAASSTHKATLLEFLTLPQYRAPLLAVIGIMLVQQLTGINAIIMYGVSVLRDLIPGPNGAPLINVFISVVNLVVTWYSSRFFDRAGRKPCLMISITGMGVNSFLLGIGIIYQIPLLSALATVLFVASFSIGLGPIPWMVAAETVPFNAAGAAQSISLFANWMGTFTVSFGFPVLAATFIGKGGMFLVFAGVAAFGGWFVNKFVPETKGMQVEEAWRVHRNRDRTGNGAGFFGFLGLGASEREDRRGD